MRLFENLFNTVSLTPLGQNHFIKIDLFAVAITLLLTKLAKLE